VIGTGGNVKNGARIVAAGALGLSMLLVIRGCGSERAVVERVAEVEHEQWMAWSKNVAPEVSPERRARWRKLWVPYKDLPEEEKEKDRAWARRALEAASRK
jgi:hypothetical protein